MPRDVHRLNVTVLALALACAACCSGCIIPRFDPECPETGDCDACIDTSGCGFCTTTSRCVPGTSMGPDDHDACAPASWRFDSCDEPPRGTECIDTDCSSCNSTYDEEECGWCVARAECWPVADPPSDCQLVTDRDTCY